MADRNTNLNEVVDTLLKGMDSVFSAKTVVGEPRKIGETTIIPLVDVTFGLGAGTGDNSKKGSGSGAGGIGGKMSPNSVLVIKNGITKIVNVRDNGAIGKIVDMIPDIVDKVTKPKDGSREPSDDEILNRAFPEDK
ncbi:MAG: GerW family sporulation protein [Lachnospiraceae bacterium]|nr:GerW family sporulation protein [Lachnospiraceae bacterium]